jgi:hypothetical protein
MSLAITNFVAIGLTIRLAIPRKELPTTRRPLKRRMACFKSERIVVSELLKLGESYVPID